MASSVEDSTKNLIEFKVAFTPRVRWVDKIYLGNMLVEVLGHLKASNDLFDFEVTEEYASEGT